MRTSNRKSASAFFLSALLMLSSACSDERLPTDPEDLTFASSLGVDLANMTRTSTGLYYQDITVGTGAQAVNGASVSVDYTGWLHNGQQFDSSSGRGPYTINVLGNREVIDGWDQGLVGMRAGGRRLLVIPPHLAYGAAGAGQGVIPPYATLVFRVDLRTVVVR